MMETIAHGIAAGGLIPYLGPGVLELGTGGPLGPASTRALVDRLSARVAVPGRIRGNLWAAAQYIESHRHRVTLGRAMTEIFAPAEEPNPLHRWLAALPGVRLIVDTWYDATLTAALSERTDWGQVKGISRAGKSLDTWVSYHDAGGDERAPARAAKWNLLVYKPHGGVWPVAGSLVSDSDYVEVLTEIDLQTPIPPMVQAMRTDRGFVFLGCRFFDQMLRTYARQIMKRSAGPHYAVLPGNLTPNEEKFLAEQNILPVVMPLAEAVAAMREA
ncbi:MAG: SIR2 family protein [Alphaproteobacteria bacterium]|nr:SIR2 family protein [Alphaproteobacteria bacterium]